MNDGTLLDEVRKAVAAGRAPDAATLAAIAGTDDAAVVRPAGRLLSRLPETARSGPPVRIAVLATCTVGSFPHLLHGALAGLTGRPSVEPGEYAMFDMELGNAAFAAGGDPDLVLCLLDGAYFLPEDWDPADLTALDEHLRGRLDGLRGLLAAAFERSAATVLLHTVPMSAVVRGMVLSLRQRAALMAMWYRLNADLLALAGEFPQVVVADLVSDLADRPVAAGDDRLHAYGDLPYTDDALLVLAQHTRRVVQAKLGRSRKVLALDLDNTLWGGVVGEVGPHDVELGGLYPGKSYAALQQAARRLRAQGVLLVLASKNDPELVDRVLAEHPEMLLRADAFAVRAVNWGAKSGNLRTAAQTLGLAPDSFVFMDDSEFERAEVARALPEVALISAGGDPAYLARSLVRHGWFDILDLTETDVRRPELYRTRALRQDYSYGFESTEDYLRALELRLVVERAGPYTAGRVAQLAGRTNQFNLTGLRPDEARIRRMSEDEDYVVASFAVADRFGTEGIVGAVWVRREPGRWRVLNLVLSCRVLGRGIELAIASWLARTARQDGADVLAGDFVPSARNELAAGYWTSAGFTRVDGADDGEYVLALDNFTDPGPEWVAIEEAMADA